MSLISLQSSRLRRVARSSSAAETQAAADGDDEAVYIRLCLKEILFRQDLENWESEARQILAASVVDCRGVYDIFGSLFVLLSWLDRQEIWLGSACAQTESRRVRRDDTLVSFLGTGGRCCNIRI